MLLVVVLSCVSHCQADPAGGNGIWYDPPGWINQCLVCPDLIRTDCIKAEPVFLEIIHSRRLFTLHVVQRSMDAIGEESGLHYDGQLMVRYMYSRRGWMTVVINGYWQRDDGFRIRYQMHSRIHYQTNTDGTSETISSREKRVFLCN